MGLISTSFQVMTTTSAAIVATIAALVLWTRVRGPRSARLLERLGLLLAAYGLTAVAVLVSINIAYGGLIVSWSDLFASVHAQHRGRWRHHRPAGEHFGPGPGGRGQGRRD